MKVMPLIRTTTAALGLVALGYYLAPRGGSAASPPPRPEAARSGPARPILAHADVDVAALRDEIRAAVRDELATRRAGDDPDAPVGEPAATAAAPDPAPTTTQAAAAERAQALADDVIARGRIGDDDAMKLRVALSQATPADAMAVRLALARAVNADQLRPDGPLAMP